MALALHLDPAAPPAANPKLVLVVPSAANIVMDEEETAAPSKSRPMRATAPPQLNENTPAAASTNDSNDPMQALIIMMAVLIAMEVLVGNIMAKDGGLQDKMSIDAFKVLQTKQADDTQKISEEADDASKANIFGKIALAFECIVAVLTFPFDPVGSVMMMAGAILQTLEMTGAIPQQWGNSPVGSFFAKMAVIFVLTAGGNMGGGAKAASAGKTGAETAETSEEAGAAAEEPPKWYSPNMVTAQSLSSLNPLNDLANCTSNDKTKEILSIVMAIVTAILAFVCAAYGAGNMKPSEEEIEEEANKVSANQNPLKAFWNGLKSFMNTLRSEPYASRLIKLTAAFAAVEMGANIGAGAFTYKEGHAVQEQGKIQGEISILTSLAQIVQTQTQNTNQWQSQVMNEFANINNSFNQLTYAEAQAASVLQG